MTDFAAGPSPRGPLIPRSFVLLSILLADLAILGYGVLRSPEPPQGVIGIDRAELATVVFTEHAGESDPGIERSTLVDLGPGGNPERSSELDIRARAATEFQGRLHVFDDRGMNRIDDGIDRKKDDATLAGLVPYPGTFRADSAAAGRRRLLAAGFDVAGIPRIAEYDGVRLIDSELPRPPGFNELGGGNGPARIAITAIGDDRFVVALCDERRVYASRFDGRPIAPEQISWSPPEPARGARNLFATTGATGAVVFVERVDDAHRGRLVRYDVSVDSGSPRLVARGEQELASRDSAIGWFPALALESGASGAAIARARDGFDPGGVRAIATPGEEAEHPLVVAAWNLRVSRFEGPLYAHLGLFMVLGILLRQRPETEPRIVMYRPAPFWRRILAGLVDAVVALLISNFVVTLALGESERRYLAQLFPSTDVRIQASVVDAIVNATLTEISFVFLIVFMATTALCEGVWGTSLGKRLLRLSVVSLEGDRPSLGATLTRSAMIFIDAQFLGAIFMIFTRRRQRLGDVFAGTVVIESASLRVRAATRQEVERGQT